ncbi:MAG TPA: rhomboid family intramembrane serine protease [Coleofasciculaceae cyanobacterium]
MKQLDILLYVACLSIVLKGGITTELKEHASILWDFVLFTWGLCFINLVYLGGILNRLGMRPRTPIGLLSIFWEAFLHGSWEHLIGNTIPFIILGWFVLLQGTQEFYIVTLIVQLVSGLGTWVFGASNSIHFGASGIVFGYIGFLLLHGYFQSNWQSVTLSLIVCILYGKSLRGVFPERPGISWEGHLFGFLGGVLSARFLDVFEVWFSKL